MSSTAIALAFIPPTKNRVRKAPFLATRRGYVMKPKRWNAAREGRRRERTNVGFPRTRRLELCRARNYPVQHWSFLDKKPTNGAWIKPRDMIVRARPPGTGKPAQEVSKRWIPWHCLETSVEVLQDSSSHRRALLVIDKVSVEDALMKLVKEVEHKLRREKVSQLGRSWRVQAQVQLVDVHLPTYARPAAGLTTYRVVSNIFRKPKRKRPNVTDDKPKMIDTLSSVPKGGSQGEVMARLNCTVLHYGVVTRENEKQPSRVENGSRVPLYKAVMEGRLPRYKGVIGEVCGHWYQPEEMGGDRGESGTGPLAGPYDIEL
ncbi:hypothetical protein BV25DRAFT_1841616 [Artomyces pyxidatus]|uniref:Uncharacterized protein n=1 Tax=Artomyces pyxidatus TaxID=48021 RepID=A0ACB8SP07_9AGAM|nr:hypothetical protein BV25DRAFT_1841616 [Artomyces pyxidatus]